MAAGAIFEGRLGWSLDSPAKMAVQKVVAFVTGYIPESTFASDD